MRFRYDKRSIQRLREERGLTREQVAKVAKINARTLSYLERGMTEPRAATLARLAHALSVTPTEFFCGEVA